MQLSSTSSSAALVPTHRPLSCFLGAWKRCLSARVFGTFALSRDSNTILTVEAVGSGDVPAPPSLYGRAPAAAQPPLRLCWSFGRSVDAVRAGYTVEPLDAAAGLAEGLGLGTADNAVIPLRVTFAGGDCLGTYQPQVRRARGACVRVLLITARAAALVTTAPPSPHPQLGLMMVHLVGPTSTATVIQRIIDEDTIAVNICEVPQTTGASGTSRRPGAEPTIQFGYCFRLKDGEG